MFAAAALGGLGLWLLLRNMVVAAIAAGTALVALWIAGAAFWANQCPA